MGGLRKITSGLMLSVVCLAFLEVGLRYAFRLRWAGDEPKTLYPESVIHPVIEPLLIEFVSCTNSYIIFDRELGWGIRPGVRQIQEGAVYTSNQAGIRGTRDYTPVPPPEVTRLAAFGPSFTHGDEVSDEETWTFLMESANPALEVMNWGVGAYGTDQAYLRYVRRGKAYNPHVVLIGYEEDNYLRNLNRFHAFYNRQGLPLAKPIFIESDCELVLIDQPFTSLAQLATTAIEAPNRFLDMIGKHDMHYDPLRYRRTPADASLLFRLLRTSVVSVLPTPAERIANERERYERRTLKILHMFVDEVRSQGALPIVVFFPMSIETLRSREVGVMPLYEDLRLFLEQQQVEVIDLAPILCKERADSGCSYKDFFVEPDGTGHYSARGNRLVADAILHRLSELDR